MYKPSRTHVVVDALPKLLNIIYSIGVFDQTIDANMFYTKPEWLNDAEEFLRTR